MKVGPSFMWLLVTSFLVALLTAFWSMFAGADEMHSKAVALLSMIAEWPVIAAILAGGAAIKFEGEISELFKSKAEALRAGTGSD